MILTVSSQKLLDRIPHLAWLMTNGGEILMVNQQWCKYIGESPPDAERPWLFAEILRDEQQESWLYSWPQRSSLQQSLELKLQLPNTQGNWEWFKVELDPDCNEFGQTTWIGTAIRLGGEAVVYDITDRKQLEILNHAQTADLQRLNNSLMLAQQQLQERNQELDRFVSIAAHDLKAPLRAIANLSEWIEEDLQAQIPGENLQLQLLRQRVKRMDALIDGLLRYSRAGRAELATETVDIGEVLAETIDSLSRPAGFEIKVVNSMPILDTKRLLLTQVFANLINNAIEHHDRVDGRIEITVEDLGDRDLFSIVDDGPGIPDGESRERIFEIFQTLHPATDSTKNTGIGLALVKKIVEGEGGEIWLDGECELGCRFCFTWLKAVTRFHAEI